MAVLLLLSRGSRIYFEAFLRGDVKKLHEEIFVRDIVFSIAIQHCIKLSSPLLVIL